MYDHDEVHAENKIDREVQFSLMRVVGFLQTKPCTDKTRYGKTIIQAYSIEHCFPGLPAVVFAPETIIETYCYDFNDLNLNMTIQKQHPNCNKPSVLKTYSLTANNIPTKQIYRATVDAYVNKKTIYVDNRDFWISLASALK